MKFITILLGGVVLILGILLGFFFKNFPYITWNREVKIYEVFQICATIFVGLIIPFFIKKWIDDKRNLKSVLVEECKEALKQLKLIKDKIELVKATGELTAADKDLIINLFADSDLKNENLINNLKLALGPAANKIAEAIKSNSIEYWKNLTGGSFMVSTYTKIDDSLHRSQKEQFSKLENSFMQAIIHINKL